MTWMTILGGLFGAGWLMSGEDEIQRSDQPRIDGPLLIRPPDAGLRAPPPVFQKHPQLIRHPQGKNPPTPHQIHGHQLPHGQERPQTLVPPTPAPGDPKDPAYQKYLREYEEWYKQWYHYYIRQYQENPTHHHPHAQQGNQHPQIVNPQQNPNHKPINPHLVQQGKPVPNPVQVPVEEVPDSRVDSSISAPQNVIPPGNLRNTNHFGTFIPESERVRNTHFQVSHIDQQGNLRNQQNPQVQVVQSQPAASSPRPVYVPTTEGKTETKQVPKPEAVGSFSAPKTATILAKDSTKTKPKTSTLIAEKNSKKKTETQSTSGTTKQTFKTVNPGKSSAPEKVVKSKPITASQVQPSSLVRQPPLTAQIVPSVAKKPAQQGSSAGNTKTEQIDSQFGSLVTSSGFKPIVPQQHNGHARPIHPATPPPRVSGVTSGNNIK